MDPSTNSTANCLEPLSVSDDKHSYLVLKERLKQLDFIRNLPVERQATCVSELINLRQTAFFSQSRRRTTKIKTDLVNALAEIKKGNFDLSWMPSDCWPLLRQEEPLTPDFIKRKKRYVLQLFELGISEIDEEARAFREDKGGPDKNYDLIRLADGLSEIFRKHTGAVCTHTFKNLEGFTSDFDRFSLDVWRVLIPEEAIPHQSAFATALGKATKTEMVSKVRKLRIWRNKRDVGPPLKGRKMVS